MLEWICAVLGLVQGVLIAINKRSNWIVYMAQMAGLFVFSLMNHLYGDMTNSLIYFAFGVVGYIRWGKEKNSLITVAGKKERIVYCIIITVSTLILFAILKRTDDPLPLLDAVTTTSSFVATYYMIMKKLDTWVIWFINDILYLVEYIMLPDKAIILAILNLIWTGLAVFSFFNWRAIMIKQNNSDISSPLA